MMEDTPQWIIDMAKQDETIARLQDELAEARRERDAAIAARDAERERCAKIAEASIGRLKICDGMNHAESSKLLNFAAGACQYVAIEIRSGT